jgi:hypothetical protein
MINVIGERSLPKRMFRAAKLDSNLYEEVEADTTANRQAFTVVVIGSLASGIGSGIAGTLCQGGLWFCWGLLIGVSASLAGWLLWALFAYWIGMKIFKGPETEATYGQLLRTLGFANSPRILTFFVFIPDLGGILTYIVNAWALTAGVIAVRQALDFSTWRAFATCVVGLAIFMVLVFLVTTVVLGSEAFF